VAVGVGGPTRVVERRDGRIMGHGYEDTTAGNSKVR
jgi:hypothetical protein